MVKTHVGSSRKQVDSDDGGCFGEDGGGDIADKWAVALIGTEI